MSHAAKHFDPQLGIDIHTYLLPMVPLPVPLPTPHIGLVFDPFDYIPFIGGTINVNGVKRATAGTGGLAVHIPIFGMWMPQIRMPMGPQFMDDELFMGSMTVVADGDPLSRIGLPVLDCNVFGMIPPFRLKKPKKPHFSMSLPTSINLAIPNGVTVGGPPMISILGMAFKGAFAGLGALRRSKLGQRAADALTNAKRAVFKNLPSGFLKCKVLRAEPVDIRSGSVVVAHEDFALPGRLPLAWARVYRSDGLQHGAHPGACGHGWETPADIRLEIDPDGVVLLHEPGAGAAVFPQLPAAPGATHAVMELVDGARLSWVQTPVEATPGRPAGHTDELQVHLKGDRLYRFAKPAANVQPLHRPLRLPIERITDLCGNFWRFERDGERLLRIVESGTFEIDEAGQRHELAGRYIDVHAPYGRLQTLSLHDPATGLNHPLVSYQYDAADDLIAALDPLDAARTFGYDRHHLVRHTDRNGLSFYYAYNGQWQVEHAWGDGGLHDYRFRYDALLRETEVIDPQGHSSLIKFDENHLPLCEIDPLNGVTVFEYDEVGRTTAVVDQIGGRTEFSYDLQGNLVRMVLADGSAHLAEYDNAGRTLSVCDSTGSRFQQHWDGRGLLTDQTDPLGATSRYEYDPHGQLRLRVDRRGGRTGLRYDRHGQLTQLLDALGRATTFEHDAMGHLVGRVDAMGGESRYRRDRAGRLVEATSPGEQNIRCEYDAEGRLVRHLAEDGSQTLIGYFGVDAIRSLTRADGSRVQYQYDQQERLIGLVNERGEAYGLAFDALGRIVRETDYWGQSTQLQYDAAGSLRHITDPMGRGISFETDPLGRVVSKTVADELAASGQRRETFRYDPSGRLVELQNQHSHVKRRFDAAGRLVEEKQNDFSITYDYDASDNLERRRTSAGNDLLMQHDLADRPVLIRINDQPPMILEYDVLDRPVREQLSAELHRSRSYEPGGRLIAQSMHASGKKLFETLFSYDRCGRLTKRDDSANGTDHYRYDPVGRLLAHTDPSGHVATWLRDQAGEVARSRVREVQMRRVAGDEDSANTTWSREAEESGVLLVYDRAGNVAERVLTTQHDQPRLQLVWDADRRLQQSRWEGGQRHGQTTRYGYDPAGRRVFKQGPDRTTWFYWDGDALLGEVTRLNEEVAPTVPRPASGAGARVHDLSAARRHRQALTRLFNGVREFVYWPGSFEPLAFVEGAQAAPCSDATASTHLPPGSTAFFYNDPNGAPARVVDHRGRLLWNGRLDVNGLATHDESGLVSIYLRLQGQYADIETGLHYNRYRYHDPRTGRFLSQDPLGVQPSADLYGYGRNTIGWIDPLGLSSGGAEPVRLGQSGENVSTQYTGLPKNTERIPSASGRRAYRIPDHMDASGRYIAETKNVARMHLSSQILDDKAYVLRGGGPGRVDIIIDVRTRVTPQLLREHLDPASPIHLITRNLNPCIT